MVFYHMMRLQYFTFSWPHYSLVNFVGITFLPCLPFGSGYFKLFFPSFSSYLFLSATRSVLLYEVDWDHLTWCLWTATLFISDYLCVDLHSSVVRLVMVHSLPQRGSFHLCSQRVLSSLFRVWLHQLFLFLTSSVFCFVGSISYCHKICFFYTYKNKSLYSLLLCSMAFPYPP